MQSERTSKWVKQYEWGISGVTGISKIPEKKKDSRWNSDSVLNFGTYNGKTVDMVFATDAHYIAWCIEHVDYFYINDLDYLQKMVFN